MPLAAGPIGVPTPAAHDDQAASSTLLVGEVTPEGPVTRRRAVVRTTAISPKTPTNLVVLSAPELPVDDRAHRY